MEFGLGRRYRDRLSLILRVFKVQLFVSISGSVFKFAGNFDEYEATRTAKKSKKGRYLLTNIEIERDSYVVQYEGTAIPSGTFKIGVSNLFNRLVKPC